MYSTRIYYYIASRVAFRKSRDRPDRSHRFKSDRIGSVAGEGEGGGGGGDVPAARI